MDVRSYFKEGLRYNLISTEEDNQLGVLSSFIAWSVEKGRRCIYFTDSQLNEDLDFNLKKYGLNLVELIGCGKLLLESAKEFFVERKALIEPRNLVEIINNALEDGYSGLSIISDRDVFFENGFTEDVLYNYEKELNSIVKSYSLSALSCYNIDRFGVDTLLALTSLNPCFIYKIGGEIKVYSSDKAFYSSAEVKDILYGFLKRREKIKKQNKVYQFIGKLSGELSYKKDESDIIQTGLNSICQTAYAHHGFVVMVRDGVLDEKNIIRYRVPDEIMDVYLKSDFIERYHRNNIFHLAKSMIHTVDEMEEDKRAVFARYNIYSCIIIPIKYNDDIYGYMWLTTQDRYISFNETAEFLYEVCETMAKMITEYRKYKKIQDSLIQSRKMQALGEFTGGIAHEFNNILTPIISYVQLLKSRLTDPILKKYLDIIEESANDGAKIVRRIQDFSRNKKREKELVDIDRAIEQAVEIARPKWSFESQINNNLIDINLNLNSNAFVEGAMTEVKEIFINLISNAVDAMPEGGSINISSYTEGGYVFVNVSDTGVGMDRYTVERIFEPFFTTKNERGNGLGLSIVYNLVMEMKGNIEVESSPGRGTGFVLSFPVKSGEVEEKLNKSNSSGYYEYKILVIDDQAPVADAVSEMLKSIGHDVTAVYDDDRAVELFKERDFDCVICDLTMLRHSGAQLARMFKEIKPDIPFILMTGWPGVLKSLDLKYIDEVVQKPFSIEEISSAICKVGKLSHLSS